MPNSVPNPAQTSFRDPGGQLAIVKGRVFRRVNSEAARELLPFLESDTVRRWMAEGLIVSSRILDSAEAELLLSDPEVPERFRSATKGVVLEHERVAFPSYPYEWSPEMLWAAGKLTIRLAREALEEGAGIKDATPYNVLFRGPTPVFVDALSLEQRLPRDPIWLANAQFTRTFLLPLLANKFFRTPLDQVFTTRRDGIEPEELYCHLTPFQKIRPPFLSLISVPRWLARRSEARGEDLYRLRASKNPEMARFVLHSLFNRLDHTLDRLTPSRSRSAWSEYLNASNYTAEGFAAKERFVTRALDEIRPGCVLDVGCNTGHFSRMAARAGASVIAIDYDPVVAGRVWREAEAEGLNILPLVVNLCRPSPAVGWMNRECPSFLDRARGAFDCVFLLAVVHHMIVTERIPLDAILSLAADLTSRYVLIEFIEPGDSMFRRLLRGREELHRDLTAQVFEQACHRVFDIEGSEPIEGSPRRLYLLRKREAGTR